MPNQSVAAGVGLAGVMAHCGGSPVGALKLLVGAIASAPAAPEPYAALAELWRDRRSELEESLEGDMDDAVMALGSVTGARPEVARGAAPWFGDERFLDAVSAEAPAAMARLPRACGRYEPAFALCDRADAVDRVMWTAVARATTWRVMGDLDQAAAAFEDALRLDCVNWSLHLDLADVRAEQGDFAAAARLAAQGLEHEPHEVLLRAAAAAYRTRLSGSSNDLRDLIALAPGLANTTYRNQLIDYACAGPKLPRRLVAEARRIRKN
ncbi:hypothetical protein [Streptomyces atrovirens]|uniref:Tetratricopeptide repeat protein n=1 Tax=Streptomyces atrovirens TaxID=285556 RepID=A0ABW0DT95_9ACTN